jgi:hypothetical protein
MGSNMANIAVEANNTSMAAVACPVSFPQNIVEDILDRYILEIQATRAASDVVRSAAISSDIGSKHTRRSSRRALSGLTEAIHAQKLNGLLVSTLGFLPARLRHR